MVLKRAKVRLRQINQSTVLAEGDTMAVGTVRHIVQAHGPMRARQILETLVAAKRVPITAPEIKAVEYILCRSDAKIDVDKLVRIIRIEGDEGLMSAQSHSKVAKIPVWKALVERWRRKVPNVRSVA
jgi:hypothetical protein